MTTLQYLIYSLIHYQDIRWDRRDISTALVESFSDWLYDIVKIDNALKRLVELWYVDKELQKKGSFNRNIYTRWDKKVSLGTV